MTTAEFLKKVNSSWQMRLFLFWKLPAAWFMGAAVSSCDERRCMVRLPYGWRSQNPFRSTYFAAQCAAAELSTGLLAMAHLQGKPRISMLVTQIEAEYFKKASETLLFTCEDGERVETVISQTLAGDTAQTFVATSVGTLPDGTIASRVKITWSFKKSQKS